MFDFTSDQALDNEMIIDCPQCGPQMPSNLFGGTGHISFSNSKMTCPNCGKLAPIRDGDYEVVNNVLRSFRGTSRENIERFRDIAQAVQLGATTKVEASKQVEELGSVISTIWNASNKNSGALSLLLAVISLYLTIMASHDSDAASQKLQSTAEKQTYVEQQILQELQKQNAPAQTRNAQIQAKPQLAIKTQPNSRNLSSQSNRHERRKNASKARHKPTF